MKQISSVYDNNKFNIFVGSNDGAGDVYTEIVKPAHYEWLTLGQVPGDTSKRCKYVVTPISK